MRRCSLLEDAPTLEAVANVLLAVPPKAVPDVACAAFIEDDLVFEDGRNDRLPRQGSAVTVLSIHYPLCLRSRRRCKHGKEYQPFDAHVPRHKREEEVLLEPQKVMDETAETSSKNVGFELFYCSKTTKNVSVLFDMCNVLQKSCQIFFFF